jgi:LasA protease
MKSWIVLAYFFLLVVTVSLACTMPVNRNQNELNADLPLTLQAMENNQSYSSTLPVLPTTTNQVIINPIQVTSTRETVTQVTSTQEIPSDIVPTNPPSVPFGMLVYTTQSGDTLPVLSAHFSVTTTEILSEMPLPETGFIQAGMNLLIPDVLTDTLSAIEVLPNSEIVFSPTTVGFSMEEFINRSGGYLSTYQEKVGEDEILSGSQIVQRVSELTSTNPRFLLAFIEFQSGWVFGQPENENSLDFPLGYGIQDQKGLYKELSIAANQLNAGYYGWELGTMIKIKFKDGIRARIAPMLNAGSVAVQRLFAQLYRASEWQGILYGPNGFIQRYLELMGDPWARDELAGPLLPHDLKQPQLELPFLPGERWSLTGGPHSSWNVGSPRGALDFAPIYDSPIGCKVAPSWVTASAPGIIVRTGEGILVLDLDRDGYEQTGWVLFYMHLAKKDRMKAGSIVQQDDRLGHPSCEGGFSSGTHVHLARKYNGEWISADGPLPFQLSGWQAVADVLNYDGYLIKNDQVVTANSAGKTMSVIIR